MSAALSLVPPCTRPARPISSLHLSDLLALEMAVLRGDTFVARCALRLVLGQLERPADGAMTCEKVKRARAFEVVGDRVHYKIERHFFPFWLAYSIQERSVSLRDGSERIERERVPRVTLETLLEYSRRRPQPTKSVYALCVQGACAGGAYADAIRKFEGITEDAAGLFGMGWVAFVVAKVGVGSIAWPGAVGHLAEAWEGHPRPAGFADEVNDRARGAWDSMQWARMSSEAA